MSCPYNPYWEPLPGKRPMVVMWDWEELPPDYAIRWHSLPVWESYVVLPQEKKHAQI